MGPFLVEILSKKWYNNSNILIEGSYKIMKLKQFFNKERECLKIPAKLDLEGYELCEEMKDTKLENLFSEYTSFKLKEKKRIFKIVIFFKCKVKDEKKEIISAYIKNTLKNKNIDLISVIINIELRHSLGVSYRMEENRILLFVG